MGIDQNGTYFEYLIKLKQLIKNVIKTSTRYEITLSDLFDDSLRYPLTILYESVNKNIYNFIGTTSIYNIYKQDVDYSKVNSLINTNYSDIKMDFEENLVSLLWASPSHIVNVHIVNV